MSQYSSDFEPRGDEEEHWSGFYSEDVFMLVKQYSLNIVRLPTGYRSVVPWRGDPCSVARCQDYVGRPALTKNGIYQVLFPDENLRVLQKKRAGRDSSTCKKFLVINRPERCMPPFKVIKDVVLDVEASDVDCLYYSIESPDDTGTFKKGVVRHDL